MLAALIHAPELELEPEEAKAIAQGLAEVAKYYPIPGLEPGPAAIISLAVIMATVYGKRGMAIAARGKNPPPMRRVSPDQTETPLNGVASTTNTGDESTTWFTAPPDQAPN